MRLRVVFVGDCSGSTQVSWSTRCWSVYRIQQVTDSRMSIPILAMHMLKANLMVTVLQVCEMCASDCRHKQQANQLPTGRSTAKACADVAVQETLQVAQRRANVICCSLGN